MSANIGFAVFTVIVMCGIIIVFGIIRPLKLKSKFNTLCNQIRVGMTEDEMVLEFGAPSKTVTVSEDIKVVSYLYSEDRGRVRMPASYQLLIVIEEGIVRNFSM